MTVREGHLPAPHGVLASSPSSTQPPDGREAAPEAATRRCCARGRAHNRSVAARPALRRALSGGLMLASRPPGCSPAALRSAAALCGTGIYPSRTVTMHKGHLPAPRGVLASWSSTQPPDGREAAPEAATRRCCARGRAHNRVGCCASRFTPCLVWRPDACFSAACMFACGVEIGCGLVRKRNLALPVGHTAGIVAGNWSRGVRI